MMNATPQWASFSESVLANHMQRIKAALAERGFLVSPLMPSRFVSHHRERVSVQMPQRRTVRLEAVLNVASHVTQGLKGRLSFTLCNAKDDHLATLVRSDELLFGGMPLNTDTAQSVLTNLLEASFSPEHIAHLLDQKLTP